MDCRIIRNIAVLGKNKFWIKEFNIVRWNNKYDKFDIREWTPDHQYSNRGITLSDSEMAILKDAINGYYYSETADI